MLVSSSLGFRDLIFISPSVSASATSSSLTRPHILQPRLLRPHPQRPRYYLHQANTTFTTVKWTSSSSPSSRIIFIFKQLLQRWLQRNLLHSTQLHHSDSAIIHQESPNNQQHMARLVKERLHLLHRRRTTKIEHLGGMKVIKISSTFSISPRSGG